MSHGTHSDQRAHNVEQGETAAQSGGRFRLNDPSPKLLPYEEQLLLRTLLSNAPVVLWSIDRDGIFTMSRGRGLQALGLRADEVVGRSLFDLYGDFPEIVDPVNRALNGEEFSEFVELGDLCFDNWFHPLRDEQGKVTGVLGVATAATERVRAEVALQKSEERFNKAFYSSPIAILITELKDGRFVDVNDAFLGMIGLDREQVIGRTIFELNLWVDANDRKNMIHYLQEHVPVRGHEFRFNGKNSIHICRISADLIEIDGEQCLLTLAEDVTEWKRAEESLKRLTGILELRVRERTRDLEQNNELLQQEIAQRKKAVDELRESQEMWRSLVENAPDYILTLTPDGKIEFINRVYPPVTKEELLGASIFDYVPNQERFRFRRILEDVARTGEAENFEAKWPVRFGAEKWYSTRVAPIRRRGEVASLIIMGTDITRQKEAEEALRQRQAQLEHVSRLSSMGEMASVLAHQLNNPLSAVANYARGCVRRLESGSFDKIELINVLNDVVGQANRASTTIQRLRRFLQKREVKRAPTDLNQLIRDAVALVAAEARRRKVRILVDPDPSIPLVPVDAIQIEQVLVNLVFNGLDAMQNTPTRQRELNVSTAPLGRGNVEVKIRDSGCGLPRGSEKRVFDAFFTTKPNGLGMGLSISRSIIEAHEGRLSAEPNKSASGCTFHVILPVETELSPNE